MVPEAEAARRFGIPGRFMREARALLWNNPGAGDQRISEWTLGLSQSFETAVRRGTGVPRRRASREALALLVPDALRRLHAEVRQRFYGLLWTRTGPKATKSRPRASFARG